MIPYLLTDDEPFAELNAGNTLGQNIVERDGKERDK
jgi:hypothetical protein